MYSVTGCVCIVLDVSIFYLLDHKAQLPKCAARMHLRRRRVVVE